MAEDERSQIGKIVISDGKEERIAELEKRVTILEEAIEILKAVAHTHG